MSGRRHFRRGRLAEIGPQIVGVLQPGGDPDGSLADADGVQAGRVKLRVGCRAGMRTRR